MKFQLKILIIKLKINNKQIYSFTFEEVLKKFNTSVQGISENEAKKRLKEIGPNKLQKKANWKWLKLIFNQFNDALVWILLVAAFLAFLFHETRDVTIILIIVGVNALIGFFQEFKAERILEQIKKLTTDKSIIFRDGKKSEISAENLVPGDIVFLSSGDSVPADGYIIEAYDLRVNSFIFTGESRPETKFVKILEGQVALADIDNMVFAGETISTGEAKFVVTGTGMNTELGKIAHMTQAIGDVLTPMQKQMHSLGRDITIIAVLIGVAVMIAGQYFKMSLYDNFLFALALAVSVVPEGLPAAISVTLSLGMKRLLKDNVLAKKLNAVETLGSVSMICTDKTGTITKNEMTVTKVIVNNQVINISGVGYNPEGEFTVDGKNIEKNNIKNLELLFKIGALCNDADLIKKEGHYEIMGDPTEGAIVVAGKKFNNENNFYALGETKLAEKTFSSDRMRMSVVCQNSKIISYVKGSPDVLLDLCSQKIIDDNVSEFTSAEKEEVKKIYNQMSGEALRVLAFAYRNLDNINKDKYDNESEKDLVWVGMMAMIDSPREGVTTAIEDCQKFGIKVVMITGDYEITAMAIAEKIGLINNANKNLAINGKDLEKLTDKEIYEKIKGGTCVFARIAPEQKLRIATILKKFGEVIAMTGDGVNDAPALKKADIGVAMGIIGTDVSREAADMILLDDNFASIVKGVKEGRTIFKNLKKFVHYVLTSNGSELLTVIMGVILQIPAPITAIQILATDLGTDVLPSFSLGLEPAEPDPINKKKINSGEKVMTLNGLKRIMYIALLMATGAVVAFLWSMLRGGWYFGDDIVLNMELYIKSTTAAYAVISMTQMSNLLQSRSEKFSPFELGFFKNKYAIGAILISVGILLVFMYLPFFQKYLHMLPIDWKDWIVVIISCLAVFLWEEGRKAEER